MAGDIPRRLNQDFTPVNNSPNFVKGWKNLELICCRVTRFLMDPFHLSGSVQDVSLTENSFKESSDFVFTDKVHNDFIQLNGTIGFIRIPNGNLMSCFYRIAPLLRIETHDLDLRFVGSPYFGADCSCFHP